MRSKHTIVINNKVYDALSGLPVAAPDPIERPAAQSVAKVSAPTTRSMNDISAPVKHHATHPTTAAKTVHRTTQRSQTLKREVLKRPVAKHSENLRHKPTPGMVSKSAMISKFAPRVESAVTNPKPITAPVVKPEPVPVHPAVARHTAAMAQKAAKPAALSSRELKEKLIAERLASVDTTLRQHEHKAPRKPLFSGASRISTVFASCLAVVVLAGYFTYLNMPSLSMRVAASQAGVNGSFPNYKPDGYHFDGPISYNPGEVTLKFASNTNGSSYVIKQQNSNWDSQSVLDNYVAQKATDNQYDTTSMNGLTIYTYDNNAAWVNAGVFYTLEGNAPLSGSQVLRIAGSM